MRNRLDDETSPYLRQHAANPVHWQPWDEAALAAARASGKPILLSVGYSACHWCHVMAHESFEDADTAHLMNDLFVNIKVDREERPDLDKIYQTAHQLYTGRPGGWPLTVFLTPDTHVPIFTGTYYPKERRYGMPAFREVLAAVEGYYRNQDDEIRRRGASLVQALQQMDVESGDDFAALSRAPLQAARSRLEQSFDDQHGGFGDAPKFPHATHLELLLAHWHATLGKSTDAHALAMVTHTLSCMAEGGLYDQLGGGFYRYSVDRQWAIPHFEKMLYDNAQLLGVYANAYAATGAPLHARVAAETADWVRRDMQDARGGYYSTLDADSEHEEGKFYVWTPAEFDALLSPDESRVAKAAYGLNLPPNFEDRHWHLFAAAPATEADAATLAGARAKLLAAREKRVWPGRDEKLLVGWNGLMIGAMARAARVLGRLISRIPPRAPWTSSARRCGWTGGSKPRTRTAARGSRRISTTTLFLAHGLLELLQCRWRSSDLTFARELTDVLLAHFADARGGFFFTADDHEALLHKPKPFADEAVPAGNGVAAVTLLQLGHLTGEQRYLDAAEATVRAALHSIDRYPEGHATLLRALDELLTPPELVVVRGTPAELTEWQRALDAGYHPHRASFCIPNDAPLSGLLAERAPRATPVAYVCTGTTCREIQTVSGFAQLHGTAP